MGSGSVGKPRKCSGPNCYRNAHPWGALGLGPGGPRAWGAFGGGGGGQSEVLNNENKIQFPKRHNFRERKDKHFHIKVPLL